MRASTSFFFVAFSTAAIGASLLPAACTYSTVGQGGDPGAIGPYYNGSSSGSTGSGSGGSGNASGSGSGSNSTSGSGGGGPINCGSNEISCGVVGRRVQPPRERVHARLVAVLRRIDVLAEHEHV